MVRSKSLTVKVFTSILIVSSIILVVMEIISVYNMNLYQKYTQANYENSMDLYCSYWDNRMESVRSSLANLNDGTDDYYSGLCHENDLLTYEVSKVMMVKKMDQIVQDQANLLMVFAYVPHRDIFLNSSGVARDYTDRLALNNYIQAYIDTRSGGNSVNWDYLENDGRGYFIYVMQMDVGYVGALIPCDNILNDMAEGQGTVARMELFGRSGELLYTVDYDVDEKSVAYQSVRLPLPHVKYDIQLTVARKQVGGQYGVFIFMVFVILFLCIMLIAVNFLLQKKVVLNPLNRLKDAMIDFSKGNMDVRLPGDDSSIEISTLYSTFNEMAERIRELMTEVFEKELEKQKIQSDFLKVQIQPHFYANILNLIYGLAQIKDYASIQSLSKNTAGYFRYLLGNRSTFVLLKEELNCVRYYIEIQKMRYKDRMQVSLEIADGLEDQLILPMVLQTFVENSIKHNITLVPVLEVKVVVSAGDGRLNLMVCDNGMGFKTEILEKLENHELLSQDGNKIGIINVQERLRMFYQDQADINIESVPGNTTITVRLPEIIGQKEKKYESAYS